MSALNRSTTQSTARHSRLLRFVVAMFAFAPLLDVEANSIAPALTMEISKLTAAGIPVDSIRSAIFLKMAETPSSMKIVDPESSKALQLRRVQFHNSYNPGVWLRTQCQPKERKFSLEECRGSVCKATTPSGKEKDRRHMRTFVGEYGEYSLVRNDFEKQRLHDAILDAELCQRSWPAWALTAKTRSAHASLEVPHHLLVIQTSQKILLWNAITAKIWNSMTWDSSRGIFNQLNSNSEGRMLFKNNSGNALLLDFAQGQYIAMQKNSASMSVHGLNSLFSSDPKANEFQIALASEEQGLPSTNLGGLFWRNGYLNWSDVLFLGLSKGNPELKPYPDSAPLVAAVWSEESGIEKSYLLLKRSSQLDLFSSSNGNKSFDKVKSFKVQENLIQSGLFLLHPEFLTRLGGDGSVMTGSNENFATDFTLREGTSALQSGFDLMSYTRHAQAGKCRITHFLPKSSSNGWVQSLVLPNTNCATGLGRSAETIGIVEFMPKQLNIFILK
jgi:hypothetical protein